MPTFNLASQGKHELRRFDVVGQHADTAQGFVRHVGLHSSDACDLEYERILDVVHMGPPMERDGRMIAHAAAHVPLKTDEITQIEAWISKVTDEYQDAGVSSRRRRQYVIHPPWDDVRDPNTKVRRYRRYSCAGFVLDAHRQVRIDLLRIDEASLPQVDRGTLAPAYPDMAGSKDLLKRFGIDGDGPWRVILAGYVLHAMDRTSDEIREGPYQAKPGDERF